MDSPVILCGLGRVGGRVLAYLQAAGIPMVVIDDACRPDDPRLGEARLVRGDCRRAEVLTQAGVAGARGVLILTSDDLVNVSTALTVRSLNPEVRVVLRAFNDQLVPRLGKAVRNVWGFSTSILTAPIFALTALSGQVLGAFLVEGWPGGRRQVARVTVGPGSPLAGLSVGAAAARHHLQAVAHLPDRGEPRFLTDVDPDALLAPGDAVVLTGEPRRLEPLLAPRDGGPAGEPRWAGWLRRHALAAWRTLAEVDLAVKVCGGVLLLVIVASTLILRFTVKDRTPDALFRVISLMATGADMHEDDYRNWPWLKVFVSFLRIFGAAVTAAFTAIVTNYLLRARLGGALEVRRIPETGHVVVCGLGNIGFRVVEELLAQGQRVAVIELDRANRFVTTTRRLGVPVIIGDASVREVLRQARAATARAVIAATSNDLLNLETALLVRELNPDQRVVLRLADPHLAGTLREAANVRLALSVPDLAAPAFVTALFGDQVLAAFLVEGRPLAAVAIQVQEGPLAGLPVREAARRFRFVPVALTPAEGPPHAQPTESVAGATLSVGDRLVALLDLADLEPFLRRQPASPPAPPGCPS